MMGCCETVTKGLTKKTLLTLSINATTALASRIQYPALARSAGSNLAASLGMAMRMFMTAHTGA